MTTELTVAARKTTVANLAMLMRDGDTGVIPIVDGDAQPAVSVAAISGSQRYGRLVGLVTDRDIVARAVAAGHDPARLRAEEIMTTTLHTAHADDRVVDVIRMMGDRQVRRVPVVDGEGYLRGIISVADIALQTESDRELAEALEEISSGESFWGKTVG